LHYTHALARLDGLRDSFQNGDILERPVSRVIRFFVMLIGGNERLPHIGIGMFRW
jgi:hypothetical protein